MPSSIPQEWMRAPDADMIWKQIRHVEWYNAVTSLIGAIAALPGMVVLLVAALRHPDLWRIIAVSFYGLSLVILYTVSTLYHSSTGTRRRIYRLLDHYVIYILIVGTYVPFSLVTLRGTWGWGLLVGVTLLAVVGIVFEIYRGRGPRIVQVGVYLAMGWLVLVALRPLIKALPAAGLEWIFAGGLFYTFGVLFYALGKRIKYGHAIWHLFVLAGSASHYLAVLLYVATSSK